MVLVSVTFSWSSVRYGVTTCCQTKKNLWVDLRVCACAWVGDRLGCWLAHLLSANAIEALTVERRHSVVITTRYELVPVPWSLTHPVGCHPSRWASSLRPSPREVAHVFLDLSAVDPSPTALELHLNRRPFPKGFHLSHSPCTFDLIQTRSPVDMAKSIMRAQWCAAEQGTLDAISRREYWLSSKPREVTCTLSALL